EDEPDPALLQVPIHVRVVDHLAEKEDAPVGVGLQRTVGDLDRVLDAEAEAEMPREDEAHGPEVEHRRHEIALARVLQLTRALDTRDHRALVEDGYVELSRHDSALRGSGCDC